MATNGAKTPDGQPDPTFGAQGRVLTPIGDADDLATCVAMPSNGKLLVAGRSGVLRFLRTALARYQPDGTLDTSFGEGGKVITFLGLENEETATAVAIDADGRAIVGGFAGPLLTADDRYPKDRDGNHEKHEKTKALANNGRPLDGRQNRLF